MSIPEGQLERYKQKTSEGEFMYELQNSYELSFKLSHQIIQTAKECLLRNQDLVIGQL